MFDFLTVIRRMYILILQQIFLIFEKFSCLDNALFPSFMAHYIRDVPRDRDASSVSEVNYRLGMSQICYLSIFTIVALRCCTGDQIRKACYRMHD